MQDDPRVRYARLNALGRQLTLLLCNGEWGLTSWRDACEATVKEMRAELSELGKQQ